MIDVATKRRWEREDERERWRNASFVDCPSCGYVFHVETTVRDDGQGSCPRCYAVIPVPKGDSE